MRAHGPLESGPTPLGPSTTSHQLPVALAMTPVDCAYLVVMNVDKSIFTSENVRTKVTATKSLKLRFSRITSHMKFVRLFLAHSSASNGGFSGAQNRGHP